MLFVYKQDVSKLHVLSFGSSSDMIATKSVGILVHRVGCLFGGYASVWIASFSSKNTKLKEQTT